MGSEAELRRGYRPVPADGTGLLHATAAGGFRFSEAFHAPGLVIPRHAHKHATITVLLGGVFEESYPGSRRAEACQTASVLFRPAGEPHCDRFGREGTHNLVVEVEPARLDALAGGARVLEGVAQLRAPALEGLGWRLQREMVASDAAAPLALEGLALELLAASVRGSTRGACTGRPPLWLQRARDLLHDRWRESGLRVGEVAAAAGVHPVHLARAFRAYYGATPGAYLRRLRLERAAEALRTTSRSLSEVALEAGFADQSHFTRAFRAAYRLTPGEWRALAGRGGRPEP